MVCRKVTLPDDIGELTLCRYLIKTWQDIPEYRIRAAFDKKDVKQNGERVSLRAAAVPRAKIEAYFPDAAVLRLAVVYEDEDILIVNKPSGMHSQEEEGVSGMETLAARYLAEKGEGKPILCHRLDNQTSGLLLFAKNGIAEKECYKGFHEHLFEKRYTALVKGSPKPEHAVLHAYLRREQNRNLVHILLTPARNAREIETEYQVVEKGEISRLVVTIRTGRMHQIRAQLSALGYPVVGDDVYGDRAFNRAVKARRLALCATSLTLHFTGALSRLDGKTFTVQAPF
ncbi:MAG: RluA family pseudouridine synthase [Eubacteriales bacterium]|nr:RluA family pseudouridine synthase [Eubacteriales bacterium]MDD3882654.1 RluA family pseudouridine synthase [Eubacteriales bacterium]MDD4512774.1 RluA family pseudouridine synthase [Eubacteriales bacterium]